MVETAYQNAIFKRAALMRQIERIDVFLELYREFEGQGGGPDVVVQTSRSTLTSEGEDKSSLSERAPRGSGAKMADAAEEAILAAGRPMPRLDILKAIEAMGVNVGGKDPGATLGSALWRERDRFVSIRGHGYWLKYLRYEPAFYDPEYEEVMGVTEAEPSDTDNESSVSASE